MQDTDFKINPIMMSNNPNNSVFEPMGSSGHVLPQVISEPLIEQNNQDLVNAFL